MCGIEFICCNSRRRKRRRRLRPRYVVYDLSPPPSLPYIVQQPIIDPVYIRPPPPLLPRARLLGLGRGRELNSDFFDPNVYYEGIQQSTPTVLPPLPTTLPHNRLILPPRGLLAPQQNTLLLPPAATLPRERLRCLRQSRTLPASPILPQLPLQVVTNIIFIQTPPPVQIFELPNKQDPIVLGALPPLPPYSLPLATSLDLLLFAPLNNLPDNHRCYYSDSQCYCKHDHRKYDNRQNGKRIIDNRVLDNRQEIHIHGDIRFHPTTSPPKVTEPIIISNYDNTPNVKSDS